MAVSTRHKCLFLSKRYYWALRATRNEVSIRNVPLYQSTYPNGHIHIIKLVCVQDLTVYFIIFFCVKCRNYSFVYVEQDLYASSPPINNARTIWKVKCRYDRSPTCCSKNERNDFSQTCEQDWYLPTNGLVVKTRLSEIFRNFWPTHPKTLPIFRTCWESPFTPKKTCPFSLIILK